MIDISRDMYIPPIPVEFGTVTMSPFPVISPDKLPATVFPPAIALMVIFPEPVLPGLITSLPFFTVGFLVYQFGTLFVSGSFGVGFSGGLAAIICIAVIITVITVYSQRKLKAEYESKK